MYNILTVDDDEKVRATIRKYGESEGMNVDEASNGAVAVRRCKKKEYDLVIMDIMMPELDGFSACRKIRELGKIPIIVLSARGGEYDKIHGFELGIDDYVVKPFSPKELMMRVKAVISRCRPDDNIHEIFEKDGLCIDFTGRIVKINGKVVSMTPKEYELLQYFVRNRGIAITRGRLINDIWGYDYFGNDRTLDTHIKLLRNNLGEYRDCLITLRGVGYRFEI